MDSRIQEKQPVDGTVCPAFCARLRSLHPMNRIFRLYVEGRETIYGIQVGSMNMFVSAMRTQGAVGGAISVIAESREREAWEATSRQCDQARPAQLLTKGKANFRIAIQHITQCEINPMSVWLTQLWGFHTGRMCITMRDGRRFHFCFYDYAEMGQAVKLFSDVLGAKLRLNVQWDERRQRYIRA